MSTPLLRVMCACTAALVVSQVAHGYRWPTGENNPEVFVEKGRFAIYTMKEVFVEGRSRRVMFREVFSTDGKVVQAKHELPDDEKSPYFNHQSKPPVGTYAYVDGVPFIGPESPKVSVVSPDQKREIPLTESEGQAQLAILVPGGVAVLLSKSPSREDPGGERILELKLGWYPLPDFKPRSITPLTTSAPIVRTGPLVSPLAAADGRIWCAWVEKAPEFDSLPPTKQWVTVLGHWDPATGKLAREVLPQQSHWNSKPSFAIHNDWICLAWHYSKDGSYPGEAGIIKHFRKLPERAKQ